MFDFDELEACLPPDGAQLGESASASLRQSFATRIAGVTDSDGDPCKVLEVGDGASMFEIQCAYHRLASLHHPDKDGDSRTFHAVSGAYRSLRASRNANSCASTDLDGRSLGPWLAHSSQVAVVAFDNFVAPPLESRRLYTGGWQDGAVRCWDLSKAESGREPFLLGELLVGGFVNSVGVLSPRGLLTGQSAGLAPVLGDSLRSWDLELTPFRRSGEFVVDEGGILALTGRSDLARSKMIELHTRGVRAISLWPRPVDSEAIPLYAATVSKDCLGFSRIGADGCSLEQPATWQRIDPHGKESDVNALQHESATRIWSGGNDGVVRSWDLESTVDNACVSQVTASAGAWVTSIGIFSDVGLLAAPSSNGIAFIDMRAGTRIRQQYTQSPASQVTIPARGHQFFAGIGSDVVQYDTRCFSDSFQPKPKVIGLWSFHESVTSLTCTASPGGCVLVAVGCKDGRVAAFDSA